MDKNTETNKIIAKWVGGTVHAKRAENDGDRLKIAQVETQVELIKQPICERCERLGLWDKEIGIFGQLVPLCYCLECGTITKNPLTYGEYLANGYDIPAYMSDMERADSLMARKLLNLMFNADGKDGNTNDNDLFD